MKIIFIAKEHVAKLVVLLAFFYITINSYAQVEITGPASVHLNDETPYTLNWQAGYGPNWETVQFSSWYLFQGGTLLSTSDYGSQVSWSEKGTYLLEYEMITVDNYHFDDLTVIVNSPLPGTPNAYISAIGH